MHNGRLLAAAARLSLEKILLNSHQGVWARTRSLRECSKPAAYNYYKEQAASDKVKVAKGNSSGAHHQALQDSLLSGPHSSLATATKTPWRLDGLASQCQ